MRILSIDFGEKRIGLALSDPLGFTAQGLETLQRKNMKQVLADIVSLVKEREVGEIVVGFPINMDGSQGFKAQEVTKFVADLEKVAGVPIKTWDERLTSREANRLMIEEGLSREKQRSQSDRLAATLILQNYLEYRRIRGNHEKS